MEPFLIVVKGGGDLGSGVAHRLHLAGYRILITERPQPLVVRRTVAFASAIIDGQIEVEGVRAERASTLATAARCIASGKIAVVVDPCGYTVGDARPLGVVDARMAKVNLGTRISDAPVVVALGPGFVAGVDAHAVVETNRGHNLGRVYYERSTAEDDTNEPAALLGYTYDRVLRAPHEGEFRSNVQIGQMIAAQTVMGWVGGTAIVAAIGGIVRGLVASGTPVTAGLKIGDIDPRGDAQLCFTISDKSRAVGGGVLEAILHLQRRRVSA